MPKPAMVLSPSQRAKSGTAHYTEYSKCTRISRHRQQSYIQNLRHVHVDYFCSLPYRYSDQLALAVIYEMVRAATIALRFSCILSVCDALASPIKRVMVVGGTHGNEYTGTNLCRLFVSEGAS